MSMFGGGCKSYRLPPPPSAAHLTKKTFNQSWKFRTLHEQPSPFSKLQRIKWTRVFGPREVSKNVQQNYLLLFRLHSIICNSFVIIHFLHYFSLKLMHRSENFLTLKFNIKTEYSISPNPFL